MNKGAKLMDQRGVAHIVPLSTGEEQQLYEARALLTRLSEQMEAAQSRVWRIEQELIDAHDGMGAMI